MTNIEQNLRVMAYSLRKQARIEFDFDQQSRVAEMFRLFKESDIDQQGSRPCQDIVGMALKVNALRQELIVGLVSLMTYDLISECLDNVFGSIEEVEINFRERHDDLLEYADVVFEEIAAASQMKISDGHSHQNC
jgi:hypothetical protein